MASPQPGYTSGFAGLQPPRPLLGRLPSAAPAPAALDQDSPALSAPELTPASHSRGQPDDAATVRDGQDDTRGAAADG